MIKYIKNFLIFFFINPVFIISIAFGMDSIDQKQESTPIYITEKMNENEKILEWIEDVVFSDKESFSECKSTAIFSFSLLSGIGRALLFFKLGYNLGDQHIFSTLRSSEKITLSSLYGTSVYIPMAVLGTKLTYNNVERLFTVKPDTEKYIEAKQTCCEMIWDYLLKGTCGIGGLISAPPLTYVAYNELHKLMGNIWILPGVPTFYVRTLIDYYSLTTLGKMLFDGIRWPSYNFLKKIYHNKRISLLMELHEKVVGARLFISQLKQNEINKYYTYIKKMNSEDRIYHLLNPSLIVEKEPPQKDSFIKRGVGIVGAAIGIYGVWVFYPAAKDSFDPILSLIGINPTDNLLAGLGATSLTAACGLTAIATWSSTLKFYDAISSLSSSAYNFASSLFCSSRANSISTNNSDPNTLKWQRLGAATFSSILAACYSGTQAEVALEFFGSSLTAQEKIETAAAIISAFSAAFWSVDEVLLNCLKASDPRTPFIKQLDKIMEEAPYMANGYLESLLNYIRIRQRIN